MTVSPLLSRERLWKLNSSRPRNKQRRNAKWKRHAKLKRPKRDDCWRSNWLHKKLLKKKLLESKQKRRLLRRLNRKG